MFYRDNARCLYTLWRNFLLEFYGDMNQGPSYVTIRRFFANRHFTRKIMEMRHTLRNEEERRRYREEIAGIYWRNLVSIDEMGCSPQDIQEKFGYSLRGVPCVKTQIKIGNFRCSVIALYSPYGFIYWKLIRNRTANNIFSKSGKEFNWRLKHFVS